MSDFAHSNPTVTPVLPADKVDRKRTELLAKIGVIVIALALLYLFLACIAGVILAEGALHFGRRPIDGRDDFAKTVASFNGHLQDISITTQDGIVLVGWLATPAKSNGSALILLHGLGDNRQGMSDVAEEALAKGYTVLMPDSRAHGASAARVPTYGVLETEDVHRWVSWLETQDHFACIYGFGRSMGAAILLQSLAVEHDFCAVAAESSFSSFVAVAPERAAHIVGLKPRSHIFTGLPIYAAAVYVKIRYGFNFFKANPAAVVHRTKTPVLLIHGEDDQEILPWHSQYMAHMNPDHVQLWIVPKAEHLNSSDVAPEEFEARIFGWFHTHTVALDAKR